MSNIPSDVLVNSAVQPIVTPRSYEFNGMTTIEKSLLFPDGCINWLPENEWQIATYYDTYGCTSFSFLNALETLVTRMIDLKKFSPELTSWLKENYFVNGRINFCDRDAVVLSHTDPSWGNSGWNVFESIRKNGLICQSDDTFDMTSRDGSTNSKAKYYTYERTQENQKKAEEFLKRLQIKAEWVNSDNFNEASKYGAIQVYTRGWYKLANGKYYNPVPGSTGHAIISCKADEEKIYDTYEPFIKQMERREDFYPLGLKINIIEKTMDKPIIKNNTLIQLVSGVGGFGLYLDGNIIVDDLAKILASWLVRTKGNTNGMAIALEQAQWDMFPKKNLRMESI